MARRMESGVLVHPGTGFKVVLQLLGVFSAAHCFGLGRGIIYSRTSRNLIPEIDEPLLGPVKGDLSFEAENDIAAALYEGLHQAAFHRPL